MTAHQFVAWFTAFAFTQAVEIPIWQYALGGRFWVAFGASAITHPFVWFAFPHLHLHYWAWVALAEAFAVIVEALYMTLFRLPAALRWSLIANGASFGLGMVSRYCFGTP